MLNNTFFDVAYTHALNGCVAEYRLTPKEACINEKLCMDELGSGLEKALVWLRDKDVSVKWGYTMEATFEKYTGDGEINKKKALFSVDQFAYSNADPTAIADMINEVRDVLSEKVEKYCYYGSGWILRLINNFTIQLARYFPRLER